MASPLLQSEENSPADSPIASPLPSLESEEHACPICEEKLNQPKVLDCLHVFCQACLEKALEEPSDGGDASSGYIKCQTCKQETKVPTKGLQDLPADCVTVDLLEMSSIDDMQIVCTSCKAKEKAVARCSDCANFLCTNCVTAHQFMRCFDNHKVVSFEEIQKGDGLPIHKPIYCPTHSSETMRHFCSTCEVPICNECLLADHKAPEHFSERITDIEGKFTDEIQNLITESKSKIKFCDEASSTLENALSELQMQRDNAKGLIHETFQSYKAMLEKRRDELFQEMEELHSKQELGIMDMFHNLEKTVDKIEDGSKFAEKIVKHGNGLQLIMMKKMILSQLLSLINNTPVPDVSIAVEFHTDTNVFQEAVKNCFGSFSKPEAKIEEQQSTSLTSSFENETFMNPSNLLGLNKFDRTIIPSSSDFMQSPMMTPASMSETSLPCMPPMHNMTGGHGIMATAITGGSQSCQEPVSLSRNSHSPAMSDSGISVDTASNNSGSSAPMLNNIQALAKLHPIGFSNQGMPPNSSGGTPTPISHPDPGMMMHQPPTPRSQTPTLDSIVDMLHQSQNPSRGLSSMCASGSMGSLGSVNSIGTMSNMMNPPAPIGTERSTSSVSPTGSSINYPPPVRRGSKMSAMQIRCKFGQLGPGKGQFNSPHGFCLGMEEDIIVADTNNHRVQVFEKTGEFKYQFGIPGREEGQLWYPRKIAVMRSSGKYVVCDRGNERSRMQMFTRNGHFVKKIAIRYIDIVAGLAITSQGHIVAVDSVSPTVFCIAETGDLVKWFDCSDYMREPSDIAISGKEYFVCDFKGHCVVVFNDDGAFVRRIGCENITNYPNGIDISDAGDVLIGDSHGNRFHVGVFQRDGSLIGEFECPYVKVSRCCGLKITSEGYVVTLAKNNHHVLVLNTLYIT
ncbi:brain tumor protein-like [Mizuhopecten yessoensis]|uniref:B-box type zinc finger protein ncl-1 n=1 Tax=Mizuhopecten yessoensis TaxID=6573 RepID=A0A210PGH1_MIZYE|nr:brain tumor protein-like [Mizuhopecten yessoensis]XP_021342217.1 brain tumor protein-like [Mizuhopecten yessoensis]XP_021342218.1 brain tumor protein-like [Mizuhopecten yessoensis]OWF35593.1 B-box type zinc finger protein ncl-1 [Mizuhopecten yessoensis]